VVQTSRRSTTMTSPDDLSLDAPWALGEAGLTHIVNQVRPNHPRVIIEFGAGRSTVRLAQAFPDAEVVAFEHVAEFAEATTALLRRHGVVNARVVHAPLRLVRLGSLWYRSYATPCLGRDADVVVVDGPPSWTRRGREAALYSVLQWLHGGSVVFLDDCDRAAERQTVCNWLARVPAIASVEFVRVGHGIACVTFEARPSEPLQVGTGLVADNAASLVRAERSRLSLKFWHRTAT
jgi:hypothetical protein